MAPFATGDASARRLSGALNQVIVQSRTEALRLPVPALLAAMAAKPHIASMFRRYAQVFLAQVSQTALANGRGLLSQRLARWLLMWHDRSRRLDLSVTHDFLGVLLGTRRATVTVSLHDLEGRGLCRAISMEFLSQSDVERYLFVTFPGHAFPTGFAALVHAKTDGNPLFMVDLLQYLRDRHVLAEDGGALRAVAEHLYAAGFVIRTVHARFMPYTFTGRLPSSPALVRAYLRFPAAWRLVGRQFLVVGERPLTA